METTSTQPSVVPGLYWSSTGRHKIKVNYQPGQDGGGTWFGQEYVQVLAERYQRSFDHCFEWCAGPGFIGFSLLDHGLINRLTLADCHAPAVDSVNQTVQQIATDLADRITVYQNCDVCGLPPFTCDLVVGNPPHFYHPPEHPTFDRLDCDPGWSTHQEFFANIRARLSDDGIILLQENWRGSQPSTFKPWIQSNGLSLSDWWPSTQWFRPGEDCQIYYIEIEKAK